MIYLISCWSIYTGNHLPSISVSDKSFHAITTFSEIIGWGKQCITVYNTTTSAWISSKYSFTSTFYLMDIPKTNLFDFLSEPKVHMCTLITQIPSLTPDQWQVPSKGQYNVARYAPHQPRQLHPYLSLLHYPYANTTLHLSICNGRGCSVYRCDIWGRFSQRISLLDYYAWHKWL